MTNRTKLTKSYIDKIAASSKDTFHWDTDVKGFGIKVTPKGRRSFIIQSRVGTREARITLGPYGKLTVEDARLRARKLLVDMLDGIDPRAAARTQAALRVTLRDAADAYLAERPLKERSKEEIRRHLATNFSGWLNKPVRDITRDMVKASFFKMKERAPGQANQGFSALRAIFNHAIRQYREEDGTAIFKDNPVNALHGSWTRLQPRTGRIDDHKVKAVWSFMQEARRNAHNRDTLASIDLVIFLMLTGVRIGEASALTWDRVNLEEGWFHLPDPKNRHPVWLPLSSQAVELLKTRQRVEGSPYVFASWGKSGHIKDPRDTMKRLSEVAGEHLSAHDLRRTFTHIGVGLCKIDLHKIELLTNHVPRGVTAIHYMETSKLQWLKPEVQQIADWLEGTYRLQSTNSLQDATATV